MALKEEAPFDDLPGKDEQLPPSIRPTLVLFQIKGNTRETSEKWGATHMGLPERTDAISK